MLNEQEQKELERSLKMFYQEKDKIEQEKIDEIMEDLDRLTAKSRNVYWELSDLSKKIHKILMEDMKK